MKRHNLVPRSDWQAKVEEDGLIFHTIDGQPYWDESSYYSFSLDQIDQIEKATEACHAIYIEATNYILRNNELGYFGIPDKFHGFIEDSWDEATIALNYGRFDFGYDGVNPPKLFEYNCDTPTSLLEASIVQWNWKEEVFPDKDQFNGIHEALREAWVQVIDNTDKWQIHTAHILDDYGEDTMNVTYMRDLIEQAGGKSIPIFMHDIGYNAKRNEFVDLEEREIEVLYKLYPWEWLMNEKIADHIMSVGDDTIWLEPIWKAIWSNKAILPFLWQVAPNHPNLLKSQFTGPHTFASNYVKKPILAREGANIVMVKGGNVIARTEGMYDKGNYIYQELFNVPDCGSGQYPVIGSWCVNGAAVGMGIREDGLITGNGAKFIPHIIEG